MEKAEVHLQKAKKWHEKTRTVSCNICLNFNIENVLHYDMYASRFMRITFWSF
jgi:hypothetical protein